MEIKKYDLVSVLLKRVVVFPLMAAWLGACNSKTALPDLREQAMDIHACQNKLSEVIIYDVFSPPVASRIYAYANLAAYEAARSGNDSLASMHGKLRDFAALPASKDELNATLAGIKAYLTVARSLTFSTQYFDEFEATLLDKYKNAMPGSIFRNSMDYGEAVGNHVINYSKSDNYSTTRGLRYTLKNQPGTWVPTPPAYGDAVEPNWGAIRPLVLDSAGLFTVPPMPAYSTEKNSAFQRETDEVYVISKNLTAEQKRIAWFWDDNALVMDVQGHTMTANKKLTPGGHWLMIAQKFCKARNLSPARTTQVYFMTAAALFDGFIGCWKIKYDTHRIRPETVIQADIDKNWVPYLQTPPFPEYPSGHSTISAASAEVLTAFFGDNVAFTDSTEMVFGHGIGHFKSFRAAAAEASESRVLGGIHYRSGCEAGAALGEKIGKYLVEKLKLAI